MKRTACSIAVAAAVAVCIACTDAMAGAELPPDVASFVERRDLCDHFRGEDPYDEERAAFLRKNIEECCTGTDDELAGLKAKYSDDAGIMEILNGYEEDIEPDRAARGER